jgi:hypothetical protein
MNHGWVITFMSHGKTAPVVPDMSVEVDDVDAVYEVMRESGAEVVHPLQDEEWGVRRFFVWGCPALTTGLMTRSGYLPDLVLFFEFGGCLVAERAVQPGAVVPGDASHDRPPGHCAGGPGLQVDHRALSVWGPQVNCR